MADALTLLRTYNIEKREIKESKENIIFADVSLPKTLLTNYIVWGTGKDGIPKDYYTLESLLFFLSNSQLSHPQYVRKAAAENVMVVRRPDRKDLLSFLTGEVEAIHVVSIDTSLDFVETKLTDHPRAQKEESSTSISTALSTERIALIKEKIKRKKYDTFEKGVVGVDVIRDAVYRERVWTNRNSVLQSAKPLWDGVRGVLQSLKSKGVKNEHVQPPKPAPQFGLDYSRYEQERFNKTQDTGGFKIDTTGTFSGGSKEEVSRVPKRRRLRTPIIVIPVSPTCLINMYNVEECLVNLRYVSTEEVRKSGATRPTEVLLVRKTAGEQTRRYRVVDSVVKLQNEDWLNVVAVFVQGPNWQFKGWPWQGNPSEIFAHMKAFYLKFKELPAHDNICKWSVNVLNIDQERRHNDKPVFTHFWTILDEYMECERHYYSRQ